MPVVIWLYILFKGEYYISVWTCIQSFCLTGNRKCSNQKYLGEEMTTLIEFDFKIVRVFRMCENTLLGRQISLEVWIEAGYMYVFIDNGITRWKMSNGQQNHVVLAEKRQLKTTCCCSRIQSPSWII